MKTLLRLVFLLLVGLGLAPASLEAATYYAATTGSDARSCATAQNSGTPKQTINNAKDCLSPGDTLLVREGNYDEQIDSFPSGASGNLIVLAAYPDETVWIRPTASDERGGIHWTNGESYIEVDRINFTVEGNPGGVNAIILNAGGVNSHEPSAAHHNYFHDFEIINGVGDAGLGGCAAICGGNTNHFQRLVIHGGVSGTCGFTCGSYAFYSGGNDNIFEDSEVYDTSYQFVQLQDGVLNAWHEGANNNIIRNNRFHDLTRGADPVPFRVCGVMISDGHDNFVYNNVFWNVGTPTSSDGGVLCTYGGASSGSKFWNNTVYGNYAWGVQLGENSTDADIRNNIIFGNTAGTFQDASGNGTNVYGDNFESDPIFVNTATFDFNLQVSSGAINTAATISAVATDFCGTSRPVGAAYDYGAYEYGGDCSGGAEEPLVDAATGTIIVTDTLTDTASTPFVSHDGETGAAWEFRTGYTAGTAIVNAAGRLQFTAVGVDDAYYASGTPLSTEYDVTMDWHVFTVPSARYYSLHLRTDDSFANGYDIAYATDTQEFLITVTVAGVETTLDTCPMTFSLATTHTIALRWRDDQKQLIVDGTLCASTSNNSIATAGKVGLKFFTYGGTADTSSTGIHFDNIVVRDTTVPAVEGATFVSDTFTDDSGDDLVSQHTGEVGAAYSNATGYTGLFDISNANRLHYNSTGTDAIVLASGIPLSTEYDVSWDWVILSVPADRLYGVFGRITADGLNGYRALYDTGTGSLYLQEVLAGVTTDLASCSLNWTPSTVSVVLRIRNDVKRILVGGVLCAEDIANDVTAAGKAAIYTYGASADTNSTGFHVDNFIAQDVEAAADDPVYYRPAIPRQD